MCEFSVSDLGNVCFLWGMDGPLKKSIFSIKNFLYIREGVSGWKVREQLRVGAEKHNSALS